MGNLTRSLEGIKRFAVESASGALVRDWTSLRLAERDAAATRRTAEARGLKTVNTSDSSGLLGDRLSGTLFILGSGTSVNELTSKNFEEIRKEHSIGVNSWVLHPFLPNIYAFEPSESLDYLNETLVLRSVLEERLKQGHDPQILHLRPHSSTIRELEILPPNYAADRFWYYGRTTLTTRLVRNLDRDIIQLLNAHSAGRLPPEVLLDSGGSVGRMVTLGIFYRFQKIVLIGVDLGHNEYFFENDPSYLENLGITSYNPWRSRTTQHETQQRTNRAFVATEFLGSLARVSRMRGGPELFVASDQSLLAEVMPLHTWSGGN